MKRILEITTAMLANAWPTFGVPPAVKETNYRPPRSGHTVAQGKRAAAKARNVKRHKAAMRKAA